MNTLNHKTQATITYKFNIQNKISLSFKESVRRLQFTHYSTKDKYVIIEKYWRKIYGEILKNNISINSFNDLNTYLQNKLKNATTTTLPVLPVLPENKISLYEYEYIYTEINNYAKMAKQFLLNSNNFLHRLKIYAKLRQCTNMQELKNELDKCLRQFIISLDESDKNTYEKQDWLILSRYICDFIDEMNEREREINQDAQPFNLFQKQ